MLCKANGITEYSQTNSRATKRRKNRENREQKQKRAKRRKPETASRPVRVKIFWLSVCDTESLISFVAVVLLFLVAAVVVATAGAAAADCAHVYYVNYYVASRARGECTSRHRRIAELCPRSRSCPCPCPSPRSRAPRQRPMAKTQSLALAASESVPLPCTRLSAYSACSAAFMEEHTTVSVQVLAYSLLLAAPLAVATSLGFYFRLRDARASSPLLIAST